MWGLAATVWLPVIYIGLAFTAMAAVSMLVFTLHVIRSSRVDFIRAALVLKNAKDRTLLNKVLRESLDHAEDMHMGKSVKNAAMKLEDKRQTQSNRKDARLKSLKKRYDKESRHTTSCGR